MKIRIPAANSHRAVPALLILVICIFLSLLSGCRNESPSNLQGYAEGDFIRVAAPEGGRLLSLDVKRGTQIRSGERLFSLEDTVEKATVIAAEQEVQRAASRLDDLRKGERPSELAALRSRLEQVKAGLDLSVKEVERRRGLLDKKLISAEEFDRAQSDLDRNRAALAELQAQLQTATLGARNDVIEAARAELEAARAQLTRARWTLGEMSQSARQDALVFDTFFEPGEFVPAGAPVLSLLPPGNIKLLFFVPEPLVGTLRIGQPVNVSYDGSAGSLRATISYISPQAAYTPPVIYSRESRAKLVFEVEARPVPEDASRLHPGQPVDVSLE